MTVPAEDIRPAPLADALSERYLAYALSTIVARSLPDVRDGLKPVHRRLLYAMRLLKLDPAAGYKKCARVVGDVIGKYHPHGDASVYDALVRLAQDFAVRYPLVDGQGNFGNIDGDGAAAMRYTEARLTEVATVLMEGLDENAVDFRATYDGEESEPIVMPAAFPNLLANGSSGIAVGMATNIPPHNAGELCDALHLLIKNPAASVADLVAFVKGPDFPTGGVLVESPDAVLKSYKTGRGSFRLRARWDVERLSHGLYQIIITEIPYQVQKAKVIERIADLLNSKKLPILSDVRDESAEDVRIVLEPKNRSVDPDVLMEHLFKNTDLEIRFGLNMNVLDGDGVPRVMSLKDVLQAFLDHRHDVLIRRSGHRLDKIAHRLEVLEGYLIAYLNLDEVIHIIREYDDAKVRLMERFSLTDVQADAILNMRLRSLRKLEEMEIRGEHATLADEKSGLEALLSDEGLRWAAIDRDVAQTKKSFGQHTALGKRRTVVSEAPSATIVPLEAVIEREPITVLLSEKGWIRAVKGHVKNFDDVKFKDGDQLKLACQAQTTDRILIFGTNGRFYTILGDRIQRGRGFGEPVRLIVDLPNDADIAALFVHQPERKLLVAAGDARGFVVAENDVLAQTRQGKQILNVADGQQALFCLPVGAGDDHVAIVGDNRKLLVFPLAEIPEMARGRGVILQKYTDARCLVADIKLFPASEGLTFKRGEQTRTEADFTPWLGKRASAGKLPPQGFPRGNRFGG